MTSALLIASTACFSRAEDARLEELYVEHLALRDRLQLMLEHLEEYKTEVDVLMSDLEKARTAGAGVTVSDVEEAVHRVVPTATVLPMPPDQAEVSGDLRSDSGDPLLDMWTTFGALRLATFSTVRIADARWTLTVDASGLPPASVREVQSEPLESGAACGRRCRMLREDIVQLRREIDIRERLVGEVSVFETKKHQLERLLYSIEMMKSGPEVGTGIQALFAGPMPVLAAAKIDVSRTPWKLTGVTFAAGRSRIDLASLPGWSLKEFDENARTASLQPPSR